jgi:opacity protein-like surface antigen
MKKSLIIFAVLALLLPSLALAEDQKEDTDTKGRVWGRYEVRQSIEFGGRITETSGNQQMYDTLVNLQSGPRLLGQELSMRSMDRSGGLFDTLNLSSFGLGGDPNDVIRLRIEKNKWYNFVGLYRRDVNFFDYNYWANPLNAVYPRSPLTANPAYVNSPHLQNTTRNMGDFNLTLFPQSAIRFRLGYSRNDNQGSVYSSLHESNEANLLNSLKTRSDRYQFGVDVRPFKRTTISFDEFYVHDKTDNNQNLNPLFDNNFPLGSLAGNLVNIGFPYAPAPYNYPCTATGNPATGAVTGGVLVSNCNAGYSLYHFADNVRTSLPTSQLSLRSNYFRKLDITANGTYTGGSVDVLNVNNLFRGLVSRTSTTAYSDPGSGKTQRYESNFDFGATYHITKAWSLSNQFRWLDWRSTGDLNQTIETCYGTASNVGSPIGNPCLIPAAILAGLPLSTLTGNVAASLVGSSLLNSTPALTFLGERTYLNTTKLGWAPSRKLSAYIGFRYGRKEMDNKGGPAPINGAGGTVTSIVAGPVAGPAVAVAAGTFTPSTERVDEYTALAGVVLRPTNAWRINADLELLSASSCSGSGCVFDPAGTVPISNAFTAISPRNQQRVRIASTYRVNRWVNVNGGIHIIESRNGWGASNTGTGTGFAFQTPPLDQAVYGHKDHTRNYSLGFNLDPTRRFGMDLGWSYMDQKISSPTCMPVSSTIELSNGPALATALPAANSCYATLAMLPVMLANGENTHTGFFNLRFKPMKRVTLNAGYELTSSSGYNNWLRLDNGQPLMVQTYGPGANNPGAAVLSTLNTGVNAPAGTGFGPNPLVPTGGPMDVNWHKPYAGLAFDIAKGMTLKGTWAYYDYKEKDTQNASVLLPRDFHTNTATVSLKYTF